MTVTDNLRENLVTWYRFTFDFCHKRNSKLYFDEARGVACERHANRDAKVRGAFSRESLHSPEMASLLAGYGNNRPFYRYGGHIELFGFREYYGMPRGVWARSSILASVFTRAIRVNFSLSFFLEKHRNGRKKIVVPCLDVIIIAFFPRNIH